MAIDIPDHWLWLGLGVFTILAAKQVSKGLQNIVTLTTIHNPIPPPRRIPSGPTHQEDAIKITSLLTLATSHNHEIRNAATRMLCARFYASKSARAALVKDLNSKDPEVCHRALLAFSLVVESDEWKDVHAPGISREAWLFTGMRPPAEARWRDPRNRALEALAELEVEFEREADARRRRREAVVIHWGDGEVGSADVYMRDPQGRMGSEGVRVTVDGGRSLSEELLNEVINER